MVITFSTNILCYGWKITLIKRPLTDFQVKTTQSYEMSLPVAPKHEVRHRGPVAPRRGAFCQSGKTQAHCSGAQAIYVNGNSPSFPVFVLGTD